MPQLIIIPGALGGGTPPPISDDIIAWYRFEETEALTVALDSKMNFHGTAPDERIVGYRGQGIHAEKSATAFAVNRVLDEIPSTLKLSCEFWAKLTEEIRIGEHGTHTIFSKQWRSGMMLFAYFLSRLEALQLHVAFSYLDVDGATRTESTYTDIAAGVIPADEWTRVTVQLDLRDGFLPLSKWYSKYGVWWGDTHVARADTLAFVDIQKSFALTPEIVGGDQADLKLATNDAAIPIVVDKLPFDSSLRYGLETDLDEVIIRRTLRKASGGTERPRLTIVVLGEGVVTKDPDQDSYLPGDQVELTGAGDGVTWLFRRWRVAEGTIGTHTELTGTVSTANYDGEADETTIEPAEDLVPGTIPEYSEGAESWKLVFTSGTLADQSFDIVEAVAGELGLDSLILDGDASSAVETDTFYVYDATTDIAVAEDIVPDLVPSYTASAEAYKLSFTSGAQNGQTFDITAAAAGLTDTLTVSGDIHGIAEGDTFRIEIEDNPHTVNIPEAGRTVYAVFGGPYTLTITIVGEGTVTVDPQKEDYALGEVVTLTAVPADGHAFYRWSGDAFGADLTTTITMDANKAVTATFKVVQESIYVLYDSSTEGDESAPCTDSVYTIHEGEEA